jgi:hypothetical protein
VAPGALSTFLNVLIFALFFRIYAAQMFCWHDRPSGGITFGGITMVNIGKESTIDNPVKPVGLPTYQ